MKILKKLVEKFSNGIIKSRIIIITTFSILTVFFATKIPQLKINSDITSSLPAEDFAVKKTKEIGEKFGGNTNAIIIVENPNIYSLEAIKDIQTITDTLKYIPGIVNVTSLTNIINIQGTEEGIEIKKLIDTEQDSITDEFLEKIKKIVEKNEIYKGTLVSNDGKFSSIVITLENNINTDSAAIAIKNAVGKKIIKSKLYFTGVPFLMKDVQKIILKDLKTLLPITTLIIILLLFIGFGNIRGIVLPMSTVIIATIWTLGLMSLLNKELTIITNTLPGIILALGTAYTIHILNKISKEFDAQNRISSIKESLKSIIIPVFIAYITTAFGFLSFVYGSYLKMIEDYGIFSALGLTLAFIASIFFIPAVISYQKNLNSKQQEINFFEQKILEPISLYVSKHNKFIILVWLAIGVGFALGIPKIVRKVDIISYFKKTSDTYKSQMLVDQKLGGVATFYVKFEGDVQSPEFLKTMYKYEKYLRDSVNNVGYCLSVADLIAQMNEAMGEEKKIPEERNKIEQLWFLIEGNEIMPQLVNSDKTEAVIQGRFASLDSRDTRKFVETIYTFIKKNNPKDIKITFAGMPEIYRQLDKSLIDSQISSLFLAFIFIFSIVSILLNSIKYGILAIIPLIFSNIIAWGTMGYTGIPLDIATVLVASVTMGVGVDYGVHIISHFKEYFTQTNDFWISIDKTIKTSGNAVVINMFSVALGFLVFIFSNLVPLQNFGVIMALSMFISGFSSISLIPALLVISEKIKNLKK